MRSNLPAGRGDIPAFNPANWLRLVLDLAILEGGKAELTQLAWLRTKVVYVYPPKDDHGSPIPVLTGLNVE